MTIVHDTNGITLHQGDTRHILQTIPSDSFDYVLTDPPYSSGGAFRSDRNQPTSVKYERSNKVDYCPDFTGDNRDQRSFTLWCELWMSDCLRLTRPGGVLASFIDWRQLPCMVDAVQLAGWIYRGIVVWDKTEAARPQKGWFRAQSEYIVLASNGPLDRDPDGACMPGVLRYSVQRDKSHASQKPLPLLKDLLSFSPNFSRILDPFAGSGTTLRAAMDLGHTATGIELSETYCGQIKNRLKQQTLFT